MIYVNDRPVEFGQYPNGETVVPAIPERTNRPRTSPQMLSQLDDKATATSDWKVRWQYEGDHEFLQLVLVRGMLSQLDEKANSPHTSPHLFIDYMPYSRMDREQNDHCFSLRHVVDSLTNLNWRSITVVEPHSGVTEQLLSKQIVWFNAIYPTATNLKKVIDLTGFDLLRDYLVLPDKGAVDRYSTLAGSADLLRVCNLIVMRKRRDFDTGKIQGIEVESITTRGLTPRPTSGKRALILDDLTSRGGTFVTTARVLRHSSLRFQYVDLLVTHMEPVATEGELPAQMDNVFACDTIPIKNPLPENFHIIPREDWL